MTRRVPQPHPGGEPSFAWLTVLKHPFHPWLLLLVPTLGGIVSEMTGGYSLLLPSLWVCTLSFILSDEQSIYSSQVESRSRSPVHQGDCVREVLAGVRVNEFLSPQRTTTVLQPGDPLDMILNRLEAAPHAILPVVDAQNRLLGLVNLEEVYLASTEPALKPLILAEDLMRTDVRPLTPDDTLDRALELFVENDLLVLPVVNDLRQRQVTGMVHRHEISSAYLRRVQGPVSTD
jgi:CIC family chloride channel protein